MEKMLYITRLLKSEDHKDRFKGEYELLDLKIKNLQTLYDDMLQNTLKFEPKCSAQILETQLNIMKAYRSILEERAAIEEIRL